MTQDSEGGFDPVGEIAGPPVRREEDGAITAEPPTGGVRLAERLRTRFASTAIAVGDGDTYVRTTASFGVACTDPATGGGERVLRDLIAAADKLMYEAKRAGRDRVCALCLLDQ